VTRVIHPPCAEEELARAITHGDLTPETLLSQCLDAKCVELLRTGDRNGFEGYRADLMTQVIQRNVQRRALFGFRDGPDPASLFGDEGAGADGA